MSHHDASQVEVTFQGGEIHDGTDVLQIAAVVVGRARRRLVRCRILAGNGFVRDIRLGPTALRELMQALERAAERAWSTDATEPAPEAEPRPRLHYAPRRPGIPMGNKRTAP